MLTHLKKSGTTPGTYLAQPLEHKLVVVHVYCTAVDMYSVVRILLSPMGVLAHGSAQYNKFEGKVKMITKLGWYQEISE